MNHSRILRFFWLGLSLHLILAAGFLILNAQLEPVSDLHLTTQKDAVLIYGRNRLGLQSFRIFKTWSETTHYMKHHKLSLPALSFADRGTDLEASLLKSSIESHENYYRIFWSPRKQFVSAHGPESLPLNTLLFHDRAPTSAERLVIHAPDPESALEMLNYIRYSKLEPSILGFSIPIYN